MKYIGSTEQLAARMRYLGQKAMEESAGKSTIKEQRYEQGKASAFETCANMLESLEIADVPDLVWQIGTTVPKKEG